jgi:SpoVK/Ycf46/Vps4 family AAA+-type ATPase
VAVEAIGKLLGLPVYFMDIGAVFGSLVGQSEAQMRNAIAQIEAQCGCVLCVDEIDKVWGGINNVNSNADVAKRVFASFLTWLARKQDKTFVVFTMNRVAGLPPELLRPGRVDCIFYTTMPDEAQRQQIITAHLKKRGVDVAAMGLAPADWDQIMQHTKNFVGAELEHVVITARRRALNRNLSDNDKLAIPTLEDLITVASGTASQYTANEADFTEIMEACKKAGKPVGEPSQLTKLTTPPPRHRKVTNN